MKRILRSPFQSALLTIVLVLIVGCGNRAGQPVSLNQWQQDFDQFVAGQNNDDISFLRKLNGPAKYSQFGSLGGDDPNESTDVVGIYLGRTPLAGTDWLVFLIAQVEKGRVTDIRVGLRSDVPGHDRWMLSDKNSKGLQTYNDFQLRRWQRQHSGRTDPPHGDRIFPAESDVFRLDVGDKSVGILSVVEGKSGARWTIVADRKPGKSN